MDRLTAVLFACNMNAVRSPMAEGIAKFLAHDEIYIDSCGVTPGELDPFVVAVMDEIGIDVSEHVPKTFDQLEDESFDLIVSLTPEAHHQAVELTRTIDAEVAYWPTPDPTIAVGSREQRMEAYREVREALRERIRDLLEWRPTPSV